MFESFLTIREIEKKPYMMFVWAVIISTVAVLLSAQIAYKVRFASITFDLSGLFVVLFTIIPASYFLITLLKTEEKMEEREILKYHKKSFWEKHEMYLKWVGLFFAGLTLSFSVWSFILPQNFFQIQNVKIDQIQGRMTTGEYAHGDFGSYLAIVYNNLQVTLFAFIFSLIFGAGSVFIISWNASILGVAIARNSRHILEIPVASLYYLPHGIPEILAYLCAGLAGGILSAAIIKRNDTRVLKVIAIDSLKIMLLAVALIFVAGFIEVYL